MKSVANFFILVLLITLLSSCGSSNYSHFGMSRHIPRAQEKGMLDFHGEANINRMLSASASYFILDNVYLDAAFGHGFIKGTTLATANAVDDDQEFDYKFGIGMGPKKKIGLGCKFDIGIRDNHILRGTAPDDLRRKYFGLGLTPYMELKGESISWITGVSVINEQNISTVHSKNTSTSFLERPFTVMPKNQLDLFSTIRIDANQAYFSFTVAQLYLTNRGPLGQLDDGYIENTTQFRLNIGFGYRFQLKKEK